MTQLRHATAVAEQAALGAASIRAAARALSTLAADSPAVTVAEALKIVRAGLSAHRAAFWRLSGDGCRLRLFCRTDNPGADGGCTAVNGGLAELLASEVPGCWRPEPGNALAETLEIGPQSRAVLTLTVRQFGVPSGLLCVELPEPCEPLGLTIELLLQLAATKIEGVLMTATSRECTGNGKKPYRLQQSVLDDSLRDLFYLAPTAMFLIDLDEGRPVAVNRHALALFQIPAERSDNVLATDFWEDVADRQAFVAQAQGQGHVSAYRARLRRATGDAFWGLVSATRIDCDGRPSLVSSVTDVSDTVAAEEILDRTRKTLMTLLEASPYPLIVTRLDTGVIRYCNQKAADMFETSLPGLLGRVAPEFYVEPSDRTAFVAKLCRTGAVDGFVAKLKTRNGQPFWAMLSAKTLELNGEWVSMVSFADVTRQKHKEEELENLAFKDTLTDAYNRRYFVEAVKIELGRAERSARPPAIALIDIDYFKQINDTHGHDVGDRVLREFVALVQGMLRKSDILARYGGEEFAVLFPETELETAHGVMERIRETVAAYRFPAACTANPVTFSAGLAAARSNEGYASLTARADESLYDAKRGGRNQVRLR